MGMGDLDTKVQNKHIELVVLNKKPDAIKALGRILPGSPDYAWQEFRQYIITANGIQCEVVDPKTMKPRY